jgi:hypothetical protein
LLDAGRNIYPDIAILCIAISLQHHRDGAMNIAIAKPKLGKDSKAFLAKKHQMLITEGQARGRTRHDYR